MFGTGEILANENKKDKGVCDGEYTFLGTKCTVFVILIYFPVQPVCNGTSRERIVFRCKQILFNVGV